jgi:hypothetical protein
MTKADRERKIGCGHGGIKRREPERSTAMRVLLSAVAMSAALLATNASAQGVNLTGRWVCVTLCQGPPGNTAFITQNGWDMNVVNEVGEPSRAWIDWPGHIWVDRAQEGAIYSADGLILQFDRGTVWQRAPELPPPPPVLRRRG